MRRTLAERMGPWSVSGPARWAGAGALADTAWQAEARARLAADSARLAELLNQAGLPPTGGTSLFQYVETERAVAVEEALACRAIRVRRFDHPPALRFGLPAGEADWQRLATALQEMTPQEIAP
jgi:cobalamin biosynthetic protein CobC